MKEKNDGWIEFFKTNPSFGPILFFFFILALATAPIHPQICAENEKYSCKFVISESLLTGFFYYANVYSGAIVAFFTATLWGSAIWQGRLTRDSINLAREEFIASHRPEITVRNIQKIRPPKDHFRTNIIFDLENTGSSEATVIEIRHPLRFDDPRNPFKNYPSPAFIHPKLPIKIKPGFSENFGITYNLDLSKGTIIGELNVLKMEIQILVLYEDLYGRRRQTSAFRTYDFIEQKFIRVPNSDLEYQS